MKQVLLGLATAVFVGVCLYIVIPTLVGYALRLAFLVRVRQKETRVFLTFDDGPSPDSTPRISSALERAGSTGTFFVLGRNAVAYPEVVLQTLQLGHRIGEHGYNHGHPWLTGPIRTVCDLVRSARVMRSFLSNERRILFRPPYGKLNLAILLYVAVMRRRLVYWSVDPKDYQSSSAEDLERRILQYLSDASARGTPQVILLHDGHPGVKGGSPEITAEAVRLLLDPFSGAATGFSPMSLVFDGMQKRKGRPE